MVKATVDFSENIGLVKRVHVVGQPPVRGWCSDGMFHYLTEAGIPCSLLHDAGESFGGCSR